MLAKKALHVSLFLAAVLVSRAVPCPGIEMQAPPGLSEIALREAKSLYNLESREELIGVNYLKPSDSLNTITVGKPYPKYMLDTNMIVTMDDTASFEEALQFDTWNFPVYVDGKPRIRVELRETNGTWVMCSIGGDPTPILAARERFPSDEGYEVAFIFTHPRSPLIMIQKGRTKYFQPYLKTKELLGFRADEHGNFPMLPLQYVIEKIQELDNW